jgi:hypothetical protein
MMGFDRRWLKASQKRMKRGERLPARNQKRMKPG